MFVVDIIAICRVSQGHQELMEELGLLVNKVNQGQWDYLVNRVNLAHKDQWYIVSVLFCVCHSCSYRG